MLEGEKKNEPEPADLNEDPLPEPYETQYRAWVASKRGTSFPICDRESWIREQMRDVW